MAEFICPHCDASVEIVGADGKHDEICDCGAVLEPLQDRDRLSGGNARALRELAEAYFAQWHRLWFAAAGRAEDHAGNAINRAAGLAALPPGRAGGCVCHRRVDLGYWLVHPALSGRISVPVLAGPPRNQGTRSAASFEVRGD